MVLFGSILGYLGGGVLIIGLVVLVLWIINKKYVKVNYDVARANLGEAAREKEAANALNLMKQGISDAADQVKKARVGMVKVQASITGLERQVKTGKAEEARLSARITQAINDGKGNDDPVLKQLATSLKRTRDDLKTNEEQLEGQHGIYNDLLAQIQNAQRAGDRLEAEAASLGAQLETSKLTAELADAAQAFDAKGINAGLEGVAKYRDLVKKEIDANNAKLKVSRDLRGDTTDVSKFEADQDAADVLAEFRNKPAAG